MDLVVVGVAFYTTKYSLNLLGEAITAMLKRRFPPKPRPQLEATDELEEATDELEEEATKMVKALGKLTKAKEAKRKALT